MDRSHNENGRRKDPKKGFLMDNSTTKDKLENKGQEARTLSRGMHYRSY